MNYKLLDFKVNGDERGKLIALEAERIIPFNIKRIYYIYDTVPEIQRGQHAHKDVEQVIICLNGSCKFLLDDGMGKGRETVFLNRPDHGLYIGKRMWGEMFDFSYGCILLVMASGYYDENEYIRNYNEFLKIVSANS